MTLEFLQTAYYPSNDLVVTNDHTVMLVRDTDLSHLYLYSYNTFSGAYDCGVDFDYGANIVYDFHHRGDGDIIYVATTDDSGKVTAARIDLANNCNVDWIFANRTATFNPTEIGDIAIDSSRVEVWLSSTSGTLRFLDIQYNKNTGSINRGVVINTGSSAYPEGVVIDSATGNAYASGRSNAFAIMVQINGTSPGATMAVKRLAKQDQTAAGNYDPPIFVCNGGTAVCAFMDYGSYSRFFIVNMTPFNQTREYLTIDNVEIMGIRVDSADDNYAYLYGMDGNNNEGALMVINANTGAISLDDTFSAMIDIEGVATSGNFGSGNLISVIGGDSNNLVTVQQYDMNLATVKGFNLTYTGFEWGVDVEPTSDATQFVGYATQFTVDQDSIAFLFGPNQSPTPGAAPEFSSVTLLLAGLVGVVGIFVLRKRK
ncbi:Uncharacterised protein [uncultured archaeon]|nr:Uncharacterised protein [uncultured archaeon]